MPLEHESDQRDLFQRLQVGVIGLVSVLIFVSVANFIVSSASEEESVAAGMEQGSAMSDPLAEGIEGEQPKEPLAELGVTPAPENEGTQGEAVTLPATGEQIVPDLEPDPNLKRPMDRPQ